MASLLPQNHYFYMIYNRFDYQTYIGCTTKKMSTRLAQHGYDSLRTKTKLAVHIANVGFEHFYIRLLRYDKCTRDTSREIESRLIRYYRPSLNQTCFSLTSQKRRIQSRIYNRKAKKVTCDYCSYTAQKRDVRRHTIRAHRESSSGDADDVEIIALP